MKVCSVEGCGRALYARSLCSMHYKREWKKPDFVARKARPLHERWAEQVEWTPTCWIWRGAKRQVRPNIWYGNIGLGGSTGRGLYAHRVAYELFHGPIPKGLEIDHVCRNKMCVNPDHLEAVTRSVNIRRAVPYRKPRKLEPYCKRGHPRTPETTYLRPNGQAECLPCKRRARRLEYRDVA